MVFFDLGRLWHFQVSCFAYQVFVSLKVEAELVCFVYFSLISPPFACCAELFYWLVCTEAELVCSAYIPLSSLLHWFVCLVVRPSW